MEDEELSKEAKKLVRNLQFRFNVLPIIFVGLVIYGWYKLLT